MIRVPGSTYLRCSFEQVLLDPSSVDELDPLGHLTDAFDMLEGKPFKVNIIKGHSLTTDADLTKPNSWLMYEAVPSIPEERAYSVILRTLSDEKLYFMVAMDPGHLKITGAVLNELATRESAVIPDPVLQKLQEVLPAKSGIPGYARQALERYLMKVGKGTVELCAEAMSHPDGAETIATCIIKASKVEGFRSAAFARFQGYLVQHLRSPGVAAALVALAERDSDNVKELQDAALFLAQLVAEGFEVDNMLELIHWAALSSPPTQELLRPKLPIFTSMIDTHRKASQRAILGVIFGNPVACANLRTIGLPAFQVDLETIRIYELVSVMDPASREEIRQHLPTVWGLVDSSTAPDILSAALHILGVIMVDDEDELREDYRQQSITEGWTDRTVQTVKQHPFAESVQQFGIELLTLLGTINPEGLLKTGAHVLARVASKEYPDNESIQTSRKWLSENTSGSEGARQSWT